VQPALEKLKKIITLLHFLHSSPCAATLMDKKENLIYQSMRPNIWKCCAVDNTNEMLINSSHYFESCC